MRALARLVEPFTGGNSQGPLRWICSSAVRLAEQLGAERHRVSERTVNRVLHDVGYSLQANRKTREGRQRPDRDAQSRRIARRVRGVPTPGAAGGLDRHEKELIGRYRNGGRERRLTGRPEAVNVHDFNDPLG